MLPAGDADQISRAELRLTDIADALQSDWVPLARQLGLTQAEIITIQRDYTYVSEQVLRCRWSIGSILSYIYYNLRKWAYVFASGVGTGGSGSSMNRGPRAPGAPE